MTFPRRHPRPVDPLLARRRRPSIPTRTSKPSWCRRRKMVANMKVGTMDCFCVLRAVEICSLIHQDIGYTALTTGELWNKHPEKILRYARRLCRQIPEGGKGAADGRDGKRSSGARSLITARKLRRSAPSGSGSIARSKTSPIASRGKFDYGIPGKVVENSPHIMRFLGRTMLPIRSRGHDLWFLTEDIRWG